MLSNVFWAKIHPILYFLKLPQKDCLFLRCEIYGVFCLQNTHTSFDILSPSPRLPACGHINLCLTPQAHPFPNPHSKARHHSSPIHGVALYFFFFLPVIFPFTVLIQTVSLLFAKVMYNISTEYVVTRTCVRYLVVHVTDTEPSVHVTPHLKPHCSYRERMAVSAHCCTL